MARKLQGDVNWKQKVLQNQQFVPPCSWSESSCEEKGLQKSGYTD